MLRKIFSYGTLAITAVLVQIVLIIYAVTAGVKIPAVGFFYHLLTLFFIFRIMNNDIPNSYKLCWIVAMLIFPDYGGVAYLLLNKQHSINAIHNKMYPYLTSAMLNIKGAEPRNGIQRYLSDFAGFPLFHNDESRYFPFGEQLFNEMLKKISEAKDYIFIEFFIISDGKAWQMLEKILFEKAKQGVRIRIITDSAGCLFIKPNKFKQKLTSMGIENREFNPVTLRVTGRVNYRNHRKMIICDGKYAFCCGINISDEYMNYRKKFGVWKDSGVMVSGNAAESFAAMFCGMWNYLTNSNELFAPAEKKEQFNTNAFVQPFSETPLDNNSVGLRVYLSLISSAKSSVYLTTPYLICDEEMLNTLKFTAERGVNVKIITPGVPDKKYVYTLTRSHYKTLIEAGIEIYEYIPGFIHAKTLVIDGNTAVAGTINFDYRSMFLLFECACIFYNGNIPKEISDDFHKTLKNCRVIEYKDVEKTNPLVRIARGFLRLIAPLM